MSKEITHVPNTPYTDGLPKKTVKHGSTGDDVKHVQKFLNWYYGAKELAVDGIAGDYTSLWIRKFQDDNGLIVDGIFGPKTLAKAKEIVEKCAPKIAVKANEFAYSTNTKKANWPDGKPKDAYKKGLDEAYPNRSKWGKSPRAGASCDVFVGTCVRCAGIAKDFPRGLGEQWDYLAKSKKFELVKNPTTKNIQDGDIITYSKASGGHICIAFDGKIKEAGHDHYYPKTTNYLASRLSTKGKKWLKVYRAKTTTTTTTKKEQTWVDKANAWARKIAADNTFHYVKWKSGDAKTHECPICHDHPEGYSHGWNCIGFAFAVWHHGGGLKNKCNCQVISNQVGESIANAKTDAQALSIAQSHVGLKDIEVIRNNGKNVPKSKWKAGDIGLMFNGSTFKHTFYIMGDGKIADSSGRGGDGAKDIAVRNDTNYTARVIIRYTGK